MGEKNFVIKKKNKIKSNLENLKVTYFSNPKRNVIANTTKEIV